MSMSYEQLKKQISESTHFVAEHRGKVELTRKAVGAAAAKFVEVVSAALPAEVVQRATTLAKEGDVARCVAHIRPFSVAMAQIVGSTAVWDMVDAANFFDDAVGSSWPYFTQEKRHQSLHWAEGHAVAVMHRLKGGVA